MKKANTLDLSVVNDYKRAQILEGHLTSKIWAYFYAHDTKYAEWQTKKSYMENSG